MRAWPWGDTIKEKGTLDRCDPGYVGGNDSGAQFTRSTNSAVRWNNGVSVFGVTLTAQRGFSKNVTIDCKFRGPTRKKHYVCGQTAAGPPARAAAYSVERAGDPAMTTTATAPARARPRRRRRLAVAGLVAGVVAAPAGGGGPRRGGGAPPGPLGTA